MAMLNVEPNKLRALAAEYRQEANDLRGRMVRLNRQVEPLLSDWVGSTSSSFRNVAESIDARQYELIHDLEQMAAYLDNAANAFESQDRNISSAFDF